MLGKLLKYDLKWLYKVIIVFYVLSFIFAIFTRICSFLGGSVLFVVLKGICSGVTIAMILNSLINGIIRSWVRLINNVYKDESYLTHTLPVSKSNIYLSKVLSAIISSFITVIVAVLCLFISYYSKENIDILKNMLELTATTYDTSVIAIILTVSFIVFLEIVFLILVGYAGIIIGHKSNKNKMSKSIIISLLLYIGTSAVSVGLVMISAIFNKDIMNIVKTNAVPSISVIKILMLSAIVIYLIYNIVYYIIGINQLKKGVNVD